MSVTSMSYGRQPVVGLPPVRALFARAAKTVGDWINRCERLSLNPPRDDMTARDVLAWAESLERSDPEFAADLRAAVWRAEEGR